MGALEHYCLEIFPLYKERFSEAEFIRLFTLLGEEKANMFYRACLNYIQSQKCITCDPEKTTSLALSLICTSIETVSNDSKKYPYPDWLVKYKLDDLVEKQKNELKKELQKAFKEYLESPQRTGKRQDFTNFLLDYCPLSIRTPPIKCSQTLEQEKSILQPIPFEESIKYIYSRVRSPFMHESVTKVDIPERFTHFYGLGFLDFYRNKYYHIDVKVLPVWFSNIVKESLFEYLRAQRTPPPLPSD
jgi:hypothetical protein